MKLRSLSFLSDATVSVARTPGFEAFCFLCLQFCPTLSDVIHFLLALHLVSCPMLFILLNLLDSWPIWTSDIFPNPKQCLGLWTYCTKNMNSVKFENFQLKYWEGGFLVHSWKMKVGGRHCWIHEWREPEVRAHTGKVCNQGENHFSRSDSSKRAMVGRGSWSWVGIEIQVIGWTCLPQVATWASLLTTASRFASQLKHENFAGRRSRGLNERQSASKKSFLFLVIFRLLEVRQPGSLWSMYAPQWKSADQQALSTCTELSFSPLPQGGKENFGSRVEAERGSLGLVMEMCI